MLALKQEAEADQFTYKLARQIMAGMYTEEECQYVLTVSRVQSFHTFGWEKGSGAGSFNFGAIKGEGPNGSFIFVVAPRGEPEEKTFTLKCYESLEQGFQDLVKIVLKPNVRDAIKLGGLQQIIAEQKRNNDLIVNTADFLKVAFPAYLAMTGNIGWNRHLSVKPNLFAVASLKFNGTEWHSDIEYMRGDNASIIRVQYRSAYPNPETVRIVSVGPVIGYNVEDKEGKVLSV